MTATGYTTEDLALLSALRVLCLLEEPIAIPVRLYDALRDRDWVSRRLRLTRVGARELRLYERARLEVQ